MSLTAVRTYFRARMNERTYVEHTDGFNINNIPSTLLHKSYNLLSGPVRPIKQNQEVIEVNSEITVRFFLKGYRKPAEAIDLAIAEEEAIIKSSLNIVNKTLGSLKNVVLISSDRTQLDETNDNSVVVNMIFSTMVMLCPS